MHKITRGISTLNLKNDFLPLNEWYFIYYIDYLERIQIYKI